MNKKRLKKLALLGLTSGLCIAQGVNAEEAKKGNEDSRKNKDEQVDPNEGNLGYKLMTEDELMIELNAEGQKMYKELSAEGKALALEVASMRCQQTNPCAGLNACATDDNKCAGKGSCKGKGKCAVSNKNDAVKLVHDKLMKEKREKANTK